MPGKFGLTRWANEVSPDNALPEYPRPQMARDRWLNLNGLWDYAVTARELSHPEKYQGKILVPFPIEAPLSGVGKMINAWPGRTYPNSRLWYQRSFSIPAAWKGDRILLHFGAVNWESIVYLNGTKLGVHRGGYDGYSFDVTDALFRGSENELVVAVWNPLDEGGYPRGKQTDMPNGIWYTPSSGIWQTVWVEPVPEVSISNLKLFPDLDRSSLQVICFLRGTGSDLEIKVTLFDAHKKLAETKGKAGNPLTLAIPNPKLWWPDSPFLYRLKVSVLSSEKREVDAVESYFGMRKVSIGKDGEGITRILLNNKFVLQNGVLDQGFWPDGLYTAPTDAALQYDVEAIKRLGFNLSRKHVKVEPERWYYWADKLGLLVWQDMPCSGNGIHAKPPGYLASNTERREQFGTELGAIMADRFDHPSIISWIVFNEGMGLWNPNGYKLDDDIRRFMRQMADIASKDKTRVVNAESGAPMDNYQGWNVLDIGIGQVMDAHCYGTTKCISPTEQRASVIGEYGYSKYLTACDKYHELARQPGVSGLVWTQITDVENERNGLLTYDRSTFNEDAEQIAAENAEFNRRSY